MITENVMGNALELETADDVFSPSAVDKGTLAMLSMVEMKNGDKLLDLGCGCGVVGIAAAKIIGAENVVMCDISDSALLVARKNAARNDVGNVKIVKSDGLRDIDENNFTLILSNPPYHTDFAVAKEFIEDGFKKLALGGRMFMVTKRLDWYKNKLTAIFGGVKVAEIDGYFVFTAEKRAAAVKKKPPKDKNKLSKKLQRKLGKGN